LDCDKKHLYNNPKTFVVSNAIKATLVTALGGQMPGRMIKNIQTLTNQKSKSKENQLLALEFAFLPWNTYINVHQPKHPWDFLANHNL
jgi:hypothetical protein